jgi:hypothetical protein
MRKLGVDRGSSLLLRAVGDKGASELTHMQTQMQEFVRRCVNEAGGIFERVVRMSRGFVQDSGDFAQVRIQGRIVFRSWVVLMVAGSLKVGGGGGGGVMREERHRIIGNYCKQVPRNELLSQHHSLEYINTQYK